MVDINRAQRIGDQIRKELGRIILQEVKDRRIQFVALTDVTVSRDLSFAKVFYVIVDENQDKSKVEAALTKATGFLRSRIADELQLRVTPKLRFIYDDSTEHGRHIAALLAKAKVNPDTEDKQESEN